MTAARMTRLTCDRCGYEVTHDDGHRPFDWDRIAYGAVQGDLCPTCATHIAVAMRAPDAPPPPPPPTRRLSLTIEDRAIAIEDADRTIRTAIEEAVAEIRSSPTRLLDPDAFADVLRGSLPHAEALIERIHARVKERPL